MKKIDIEAHFFSAGFEQAMLRRKGFPRMELGDDGHDGKFVKWMFGPELWARNPLRVHEKLLDLGEQRLREMDQSEIATQVLSLPAIGCDQLEADEATNLARNINDELSRVTSRHPDRFVGLAELAPQDPERAARELERAVTQLGFRGAKVNSNVRGEYLDDERYWPIFETAERLDVPIALHPTVPSPRMVQPYADYGFMLAGPTLGFIAETSLHAVRLILAGVFDRYPRLNVVLGHMGEALPFWLSRIDVLLAGQGLQSGSRPKMARKPSDYLKRNFVYNISGVLFLPAFICAYLAIGADRIAFAVDAPFDGYETAARFMDAAPICEADKEKICHLNAERLFKL
jgi:5-carboxyvanillate decarboxylase